MPVWHVSISRQHPRIGMLHAPRQLEQLAMIQLAGVGTDDEWWWWNTTSRIGHLRIGVTLDEYSLIPPGMAIDDAGETGPKRRRQRPDWLH